MPSHAPNIIWLNNKVLKNGLAHKPTVTGSFSHVMTTRNHSKESASSIYFIHSTSTHKLYFFVLTCNSKSRYKVCFKFWNTTA